MINKNFISKLNHDKNYQKANVVFDINKKENLTIALTKKNQLSIELGFKINKSFEQTENDFSFSILSNWLGQRAITGLLSKRLREEGLVYSVKTSIVKGKNELLFKINIDTGKEKFEKVIECINWAINVAKTEKLSEERLKELKDNLVYARDETQPMGIKDKNKSILDFYANLGTIKKSLTTRQLKKHLKSITSDTIYSLANEVFSMKTPLYITLLGNIEEKDFPSHKELKKMILKDKD